MGAESPLLSKTGTESQVASEFHVSYDEEEDEEEESKVDNFGKLQESKFKLRIPDEAEDGAEDNGAVDQIRIPIAKT